MHWHLYWNIRNQEVYSGGETKDRMLHVVAVCSVRRKKGGFFREKTGSERYRQSQHYTTALITWDGVGSHHHLLYRPNKSQRYQILKLQAFFCISYVTGIVIWPVQPPNYVPLAAHYKSCGKMVMIRHNGRAMREYTVWKSDTVSDTVISQFNLYTEVCVLKVSSCFTMSGTHNELLFEAGWQGGDEHEQRS